MTFNITFYYILLLSCQHCYDHYVSHYKHQGTLKVKIVAYLIIANYDRRVNLKLTKYCSLKQVCEQLGNCHSSVDPSPSTILWPQGSNPSITSDMLRFLQFCIVKRTKMNKTRPGLAHFKKVCEHLRIILNRHQMKNGKSLWFLTRLSIPGADVIKKF